ncbi:creatininase family protein [Cyanobium sp. HWJ4-Hawea]|uniref:creatininase family protein n=1 Tax=Cyanobium sp. HWJ4-Hawea TaxID=2823713 RepID=UPI0020CF65D7|nr:creatininase family protein [Cyanobium sp. HWJ4-Hawea]MCP9810249.1 creatininase family protein [Cyanobium sp. HWJ4-Hawea]
MAREFQLGQMRWPEVAQAAARPGSTVVWPFGSMEQHGPHLPLHTDSLFAERLIDSVLERLPENLPIWRLPLQPLGFSPEHRGFAGTLSLPAELLIAQVVAVGQELAGYGFQRLVLFNGHGGQISLLQTAARQLRSSVPTLGVLPCFIWSGPEGIQELIPEPERSEGLHAALAETSLMLHLAPGLVAAERPIDGNQGGLPPRGWSLEGAAPNAWLTRDLSSTGVVGNSSGANAELGAELWQKLGEGWLQRFESLLASDWPPTDRPEAR